MRKRLQEFKADVCEQVEAFRRTERRHSNSYRELSAGDRRAEAPADVSEEKPNLKQLLRQRLGWVEPTTADN